MKDGFLTVGSSLFISLSHDPILSILIIPSIPFLLSFSPIHSILDVGRDGIGKRERTRNGMSPLFLSQPYLQVIPRVGKERYDMGDGMEKSREFESLWRLFPIIHPIYSFPYLSFFSLPCVSCLFHRLTTQSRKTREARRNGEVIPSFFLSRSFPPVRSLPMVSPFAPFGHSSTRLFPKLLSGAVINPRESGEVGSFIYFSSLCHLQQFTLGTR